AEELLAGFDDAGFEAHREREDLRGGAGLETIGDRAQAPHAGFTEAVVVRVVAGPVRERQDLPRVGAYDDDRATEGFERLRGPSELTLCDVLDALIDGEI